nr:hypothetical protein [Mycoplasmopsis bovis]
MRIVDLIEKKRLGKSLSNSEIDFLLGSYVKGQTPDYQMVCFFNGCNVSRNGISWVSLLY